MPVTIATKNGEQTFDKPVVTIGTHPNCEVKVQCPVDFILIVELGRNGGFRVTNKTATPDIMFKGQPMGNSLIVERGCKLMVNGTDDFVGIKLGAAAAPRPQAPQQPQNPQPQMQGRPQGHRPQQPMPQQMQQGMMQNRQPQMRRPMPNGGGMPMHPQGHPQRMPQQPQQHVTLTSIAQQDFNEEDIRELYGEVNAATKIKLEKRKSDIESRRVSILKEISFALEDAKKKISANGNAERFLGLALIFCPIIMASAVSDTLRNLLAENVRGFFPLHMRLLAGYAVLLFVNSLILKQGIFLLFQDKGKEKSTVNKKAAAAKNFMLMLSAAIFLTVGGIIVSFYLNTDTPLDQGSTIISMVCLFALVLCAVVSGYFKSMLQEASVEYDKYESREDFKGVIQDYQQWIGLFINNLSSVKLRNIKNKQFTLKLKSVGEIALGIITSPFLAYAVSNTLGTCIPDAAGWIRISGLRISPVFLALATLMIIFAFFTLAQAFTISRRVNGSEVVKKDGFANYMHHGVDLFGTEAVKKLKSDAFRSFLIAGTVIFIEFTMNVSYFMQEIGGGEWGGILMSVIAAFVPTALLIAETFMLSHTQYEMHICDEIIDRLDKDIDE